MLGLVSDGKQVLHGDGLWGREGPGWGPAASGGL